MHQEKVNVGNSGFFVWANPIPAVGTGYTRGIEVQVLVNLTYYNKKGDITATSQGDLFSIWGARCTPERPHPNPGTERCLPSENRTKGGGEWNHYRVVANDGTIRLEVNGKEVSSGPRRKCSPVEGYLGSRIRRLRVLVQEPQDQGIAEHQPESGRHRRRRPGLQEPVVRTRLHQLEDGEGRRGPLEGPRLDPRLRRQEHRGRQEPMDRQGIRRLRADRRLAAAGAAQEARSADARQGRQRRQGRDRLRGYEGNQLDFRQRRQASTSAAIRSAPSTSAAGRPAPARSTATAPT